jgi:hypothetical protein
MMEVPKLKLKSRLRNPEVFKRRENAPRPSGPRILAVIIEITNPLTSPITCVMNCRIILLASINDYSVE